MKKISLYFAVLCLVACNGNNPLDPTSNTDNNKTTIFVDNDDDYVDLGLPSGTRWKNKNESNENNYSWAITDFQTVSYNLYGLYDWLTAREIFGINRLPTENQFQELRGCCRWSWQENGMLVVGPNGNSITLPGQGYIDQVNSGLPIKYGERGYYWCREQAISNKRFVHCFSFCWLTDKPYFSVTYVPLSTYYSVRLIKSK